MRSALSKQTEKKICEGRRIVIHSKLEMFSKLNTVTTIHFQSRDEQIVYHHPNFMGTYRKHATVKAKNMSVVGTFAHRESS